MKYTSTFHWILTLACTGLLACQTEKPAQVIRFDGSKEMSGQKLALHTINPDLPTTWDDYPSVVLEYKISSAQRFQLGFTTQSGYNELRIMSYVPNAWNRLAIPIRFFTSLPDPRIDLPATYNQPRYTGWINLGGKRGPMVGVDSIGFRMRRAIGNPTLEIRSVTLSKEDPGDAYLEQTAAIDSFGQSKHIDYPEKIYSLHQLQEEWRAEEQETVSTEPFHYAKYGGYKQKQVKATGFFRTEQIDGRWWFVDPEGYLFLSVGVDCVHAGGGGTVRDVEKRQGMFDALPPQELTDRYGSNGKQGKLPSFSLWNQYRRFGEAFPTKSKELIFKRMDKWGLNTIGNWSDMEVMLMNRKAFQVPLYGIRMDGELMGLADVYAKDYEEAVEASIRKTVDPLKDNPWVLGYFIGNEPAWLGQEVRLCELILQGKERPIQQALQAYLQAHGDTPEVRKQFIWESFDRFLESTNRLLKKHDPHHLNLGIRFGNPMELETTILASCGKYFDVLSFNCYDLRPDPKMMDYALEKSRLPMIIGEYHFGSVDRGQAQSLWQVESQTERGVAYRYYTEQAYSHPGLIGTAYFQWCDQDMLGRFDGENYNCGLVDETDRPYPQQVKAMMETAKHLYDIHRGHTAPTDRQPRNARGHGGVPDVWNE